MDEIYKYPLQETARDIINRQLKAGITDQVFVNLILSLREESKLCIISDEQEQKEPKIICSMGLLNLYENQ